MTRFEVKINEENGDYDAELSGKLRDLAVALATIMQQNEVVEHLITASVEIYEAMKADAKLEGDES